MPSLPLTCPLRIGLARAGDVPVFPRIPAFFIVTAMYIIGEKARRQSHRRNGRSGIARRRIGCAARQGAWHRTRR